MFAQTNDNAFGDSVFTPNGLIGKVYLLPVNTQTLPDFDTMKTVDSIYATNINIPERSWSAGFPGLRNRFEWFGIEYKGNFKAFEKGTYTFRLVSDDGAKLYIDDSLIINNDGVHGASSKEGKTELDNKIHSIKIDYFQGPRYKVALQLFAALPKRKEEAFPGSYFSVYLSPPKSSYILIIVAGIAAMLSLFFVIAWKRKSVR